MANDAIKNRLDIVIEITGDNKNSLIKLVTAMKSINYKINVIGVNCDIELAIKRNENRDDDNISSFYTQKIHYKWILNAVDKLKTQIFN